MSTQHMLILASASLFADEWTDLNKGNITHDLNNQKKKS